MIQNSFLGIDPGRTGGIAVIGAALEIQKMPETDRELWKLFLELKTRHAIAYAVLEELHALPAAVEDKIRQDRLRAWLEAHPGESEPEEMPARGSIAQWKLARHYGALHMALTAADIRFEERRPSDWQRILCCRTGGDKNVSKRRAQDLYPQIKVTHQNAEALLLARCAQVLWMNTYREEHPEARRQSFRSPTQETLGYGNGDQN